MVFLYDGIWGSTKKELLTFYFRKQTMVCYQHIKHLNSLELRLVPGDELKLRYAGDATHQPWQSVGHVVKITSNIYFSFRKKLTIVR